MPTKTVKTKIIYPHLGIVDEVEEEIITDLDNETEKEDENNIREEAHDGEFKH